VSAGEISKGDLGIVGLRRVPRHGRSRDRPTVVGR